MRQSLWWSRVVGVANPVFLANHFAHRRPHRRLGDEINIGVRVGFPALALQDGAGLTAARCIAGTRDRIAKRRIGVLRVFVHGAGAFQALLVAQLHAAEVEHRVLHGGQHFLPASAAVALKQRGHNAQSQVQAGARVANLRAGYQGGAVVKAGGRGCTACALRHVFIDLAVFVFARAEALHGGHDHAGIEFLDALPGEAHAVQRARCKVFHQHVAGLDQPVQYFFALGVFGIDRDRALVVVQHGEVQAVHAGNVAQLATGGVAFTGFFHLDHVSAKPGQQLRAGRPGLDVGEVKNANAV